MTPQKSNDIANLYNGGGEETNLLQYIHDIFKNKYLELEGDVHEPDLILAYFLARGIGVQRNYRYAVIIWHNAHRHGFKIANYNLAVAYYYGLGVARDVNKAKRYLSEICHLDNSAKDFLNNFEGYKKITPSFHIYSPDIVPGSSLEAEILLLKYQTSEAIDLYKKINNADSYSKLAAIYAGVDKEQFTLYYNKAKELNHPDIQWHQIDNISTDLIFDRPVFYYRDYSSVTEHILACFRDEEPIWEIVYTFLCIIRNLNDLEELYSSKEDWVKMLRNKIITNPEYGRKSLFRDLKRTYTKCPNQVREDFCNYFWHLLESLEEEPGFQEFYSHDTFLTQLQTLLSDSNVIAFSFEMIPLKYLNYIDPHKHYILGISQHNEAKQILAHFIIELLGLTNVTISTKGFCQNNYDSLVVLPDIRNTLEDGIDYSNIDTQTWSLNDVFRNAKNRTIVLLNRDFCASYKTILSTYREKICKGQYIEKIIELPKETFPAIHSSASLISLNFENPSKEVCIIKKDKEIHVSYETLQKHDYILSFDLYSQEIQAAEDQDIVRICDIVDFRFDYDRRPDGYPARSLSDSDFHSTLLSTIKHRNQYTAEQSSTQIPILKEYNGEHLFLKYKDRVQLNLQTEDAFCFPDYGSYALRLKEGSPVKTLDYLAYILMSEEVNQYLGNITDKNGDFIIRELMYKKVAIYTNPDKQNEVVRTTLAKERMKMDNGISYNIVVISEKKELIHYIDKIDGMSVIAKDQSYVDLYTRYIEDTNKEIIDAVVVDNDSPDYESVIEDFNEIRERDIHLYIITNDSELQLSGRKKKAYFEDNNRIYCFRSDSEKYRLIDSIREDLDSSKASQARIRSKYNDVFDAAGKLDEKYNLNISETIIQYIQNGCEIENAKNTAFDKLRDVCHKLLEIFAEKAVVPKLNPGAIASLLADGCYTHKIKKEKDITYVMVHNILDNTPGMAKALEYFCFIANKEVHGQQYSSRLGTSVLNILMEFIVRFYQIDIIDNKLELLGRDGIAYIEDDYFKNEGKVFSVNASDDGKYFYLATDVGNIGIHIQEKSGLTPGAKVRITSKVKQESLNKRIVNGTNITLYVHSDGYQLVK